MEVVGTGAGAGNEHFYDEGPYPRDTSSLICRATHFTPIFHFSNHWMSQKTRVFLTFSGDIEMEHGIVIGLGDI